MKVAEFRKELLKVMPGYKWTVHKTSNAERLMATGTQSSGFNRLSTLHVTRADNGSGPWYEVKSAPHGTKSPWGARWATCLSHAPCETFRPTTKGGRQIFTSLQSVSNSGGARQQASRAGG